MNEKSVIELSDERARHRTLDLFNSKGRGLIFFRDLRGFV